jgi:hypothetical protein
MARAAIEIKGEPFQRNGYEVVTVRLAQDDKDRVLNFQMAKRVNPDGTLRCHRCDKHLPPTTEARDRNVNILWDHPAAGPCLYTDEERYGR